MLSALDTISLHLDGTSAFLVPQSHFCEPKLSLQQQSIIALDYRVPKFITRWQNNPVLFHLSKPSGNLLYHLKVQKEEERILEAILCINPLY